jgi:hypothetical protein
VTNNSNQAQQLHAREEAAGWTAAGTEEPPLPPLPPPQPDLATERLSAERRSFLEAQLRDIVSDGMWAVINSLDSEDRHSDSSGNNARMAGEEDQVSGTGDKHQFTDMPNEGILSADVDRAKALPGDPLPGMSKEVIRVAVAEAAKQLAAA